MATKIVPLQLLFSGRHNTCDRCDVEVSYATNGPTRKCVSHRENVAGMFTYVLCAGCSGELHSKRASVREGAYRKAMVRHAAKYSRAYARFIAAWYGIRPTRRLVEV